MEEIYKDYKIRSDGFRDFNIDDSIAKFEIYNNSQRFLIVFALANIELSKCKKTQEELLEGCIDIVKDLIGIGIEENRYYEYQACNFLEVKNPSWWKG